jgi:hypothetical protein
MRKYSNLESFWRGISGPRKNPNGLSANQTKDYNSAAGEFARQRNSGGSGRLKVHSNQRVETAFPSEITGVI